jgi:hypothetical protein
MRLTIQSATIERAYPGETATRRVTLNGRPDGGGYREGETIERGHFWQGWKITAVVDCGELHK